MDNDPHLPSALDRLRAATGFMFDMDGVLYRGTRALPGVRPLLDALLLRDRRFMLATNNSMATPEAYVARLAAMGIDVPPEAILTSALATRDYLLETLPPDAGIFAIGMPGMREQLFGGTAFRPVQFGEEQPAAVVMGMDLGFTYDKLKAACAAIHGGALFVATNADTTSSVSWTAPASNGGSTVTSYTATAVPSDGTLSTLTCSAAASPCTVSGMTNGVTYTLTVTATNAAGTGSASTSASAIPYPASVMGSNLRTWLDGAAPSTMFAGSTCSGTLATTTLGCWADKTSTGNNASQGTSGSRPTLTTLTGRAVPMFDGVDDRLAMAAVGSLPTGTTASSTFVVARLNTGSASGWLSALGWGSAITKGSRSVLKQTGTTAVQTGTYAAGMTLGRNWASTSWTIYSDAYTAGGTTYAGRVDSTTGASNSGGFSTSGSTGYVGDEVNSTEKWDGPIAEVIISSTALTTSERRTVEEYLARKWSGTITPAAPQSLAATPTGGGAVSLSWSAPAWDGGASVTAYTATPSGGGSCTVSGLTASCTGVPAGSRTFTVTATNSVGTGPSATATATVS